MCRVCTLLTRETGLGESDLALCRSCCEGKPGDEVAVSCNLMTEDAFYAKHGEHSLRHKHRTEQITLQGVDPYEYASRLASLNCD